MVSLAGRTIRLFGVAAFHVSIATPPSGSRTHPKTAGSGGPSSSFEPSLALTYCHADTTPPLDAYTLSAAVW